MLRSPMDTGHFPAISACESSAIGVLNTTSTDLLTFVRKAKRLLFLLLDVIV